MTKLVIFDLDGTLLNTIEDIHDAMNEALKENHLPKRSIEEIKYMVGSGVDILVRRALPQESMDSFSSLKESYLKYYTKYQKNKTKPYDGVLSLLTSLKEHHIQTAVLSNKPHQDTIQVIESYFGNHLFSYVLGKKEQNQIKPSIDGIIEIKKALQIEQDILYVGDTSIDIETAKNAFLPMIAVTWGFRKEEELKEATYIVNHPNEILEIALRSF